MPKNAITSSDRPRFDVRIPNANTLHAMKEAKSGKTSKNFKNAKSLIRDLMTGD